MPIFDTRTVVLVAFLTITLSFVSLFALYRSLPRLLPGRAPDAASRPETSQALSDREITVFRMLGMGMKKSGIAKELHLSPHTVETYRTNIKQKMGVATGAELYRLAFLHSQDKASLHITT